MDNSKNEKQIKADSSAVVVLDYQRLAEAIINAEIEAKKREKIKPMPKGIRGWMIRHINGIIYASGYMFCFGKIYLTWREYSINVKTSSSLWISIITTIFLGGMGILLFAAQQESHDDNSHEARDYFDFNVGIVALIVAYVALFAS